MPKKSTLFLSIDIEADGPVPGLFSMLSLGLAGFIRCDNDDNCKTHQLVYTYEANLLPLPDAQQSPGTMEFWSREQEAWEYVTSNQQDPETAFQQLASEIHQLNKTYRVYVVGWPVNFDWMWICYYFHRFVGECPLGFSARCIGSYAWAMAKTQNPSVDIKDFLKQFNDPDYPHTHRALDDAKEQGALFMNMLNHNTPITDNSSKDLSNISVYCDEKENCSHNVIFTDGSRKTLSLQNILKRKPSYRVPGAYHLYFICQKREQLPLKKIKKLGRTIQDSDPSTSQAIFDDNSTKSLYGPQIYWLSHKYGTDELSDDDRSFLESEFSHYYKNTDYEIHT